MSQAGQLGGFRPRRGKGKPAASYSRAGGSRTTLGEEALDFRVRDGNGYGRLSVATGRKPGIGPEENRNAERQEPHTLVKFASFRSRRTLPGSKLQAPSFWKK